MLKARLPIKFEDGKQMYGAVLSMINKQSPPLATLIHSNDKYNPFSLQLPDLVIALDIATESLFLNMDGVEIVDQMDSRSLMQLPTINDVTLSIHHLINSIHGIITPIADPTKLLNSVKDKWNSLFPDKIDMHIARLHDKDYRPNKPFIKLSYANTVTKSLKIADWKPIMTLNGKIRLRAIGNETFKSQFSTLVHFAEWSGMGSKTSMGCGVVRIEK
ncbi:hypothetical protein GCM10011391_28180 [Pullulanibacillus camelliae]|uniref:CRISPR-associated protein Cas6 C-terminal domain-containing protein n=1 Tax=Pullulanibacillus camelliae TaxID=1707096 RepID=A0A8J3DXB0_9BACL|nr:CRISPR system precrRNA processing endoribonuclease RAMP protein Cas6 [Pullulanibacillus camelliae]GGE47779.1 hypothetical protein GCM10011391_28180 [Pullulanibacillus camelliae]